MISYNTSKLILCNALCAIALLVLITQQTKAQELNANVQVQAPQVANVDKKIFETMSTSIREFLNNTKWTNDQYKTQEKIECTFLITINRAVSNSEFEATIQVESSRPVYKSTYTSTLFNYNDKEFAFKYVENQPFEFNDNTYSNNITSVIAFYAYMVIGYDYDSFNLNGGLPYFQKAQNVVNTAANGGAKGWKATDDTKNRYWIVENMLNTAYKPMHEANYKYHIKGMDILQNNPEAARKAMTSAIEQYRAVAKSFPTLFAMQQFFNAKRPELINIYSQATDDEKTKILELLSACDPANGNKYLIITGNK
jgi:hypothetical protein